MQRFIDMGIDKTQIIAGQTNTCSYFAPLANQRFEPRGEEIAKKDSEEDNPNKVIVYCTTFPETYGELTKEAKDATDKFVDLLKKGGKIYYINYSCYYYYFTIIIIIIILKYIFIIILIFIFTFPILIIKRITCSKYWKGYSIWYPWIICYPSIFNFS